MSVPLALRATLFRSTIPQRPRLGLAQIPNCATRTYSTSPDPIKLEYTLHEPASRKTDDPLVILHGLFGSKRNWTTLAKKFADELSVPVYALDLRNQGHSPHARPMTYPHMAGDVHHFLQEHGLDGVTLMGHSMGGKVAMTAALQDPSTVKNLIVVDIAPVKGKISDDFRGYVDAMRKIEEMGMKSKKEAMAFLESYEPSIETRHFLLTNLLPITSSHPTCKFRVPLDILHESVPEIGDFPFVPEETSFEGPTLFVKGNKSKYINKHHVDAIKSFFPNGGLKTLNTGHWVHAERPAEFLTVVKEFMDKAEDADEWGVGELASVMAVDSLLDI